MIKTLKLTAFCHQCKQVVKSIREIDTPFFYLNMDCPNCQSSIGFLCLEEKKIDSGEKFMNKKTYEIKLKFEINTENFEFRDNWSGAKEFPNQTFEQYLNEEIKRMISSNLMNWDYFGLSITKTLISDFKIFEEKENDGFCNYCYTPVPIKSNYPYICPKCSMMYPSKDELTSFDGRL